MIHIILAAVIMSTMIVTIRNSITRAPLEVIMAFMRIRVMSATLTITLIIYHTHATNNHNHNRNVYYANTGKDDEADTYSYSNNTTWKSHIVL